MKNTSSRDLHLVSAKRAQSDDRLSLQLSHDGVGCPQLKPDRRRFRKLQLDGRRPPTFSRSDRDRKNPTLKRVGKTLIAQQQILVSILQKIFQRSSTHASWYARSSKLHSTRKNPAVPVLHSVNWRSPH